MQFLASDVECMKLTEWENSHINVKSLRDSVCMALRRYYTYSEHIKVYMRNQDVYLVRVKKGAES